MDKFKGVSLPSLPKLEPIKSVPELAFSALAGQMDRFQDGLTADTEVGVIANGAGLILHVERVTYAGQMIVFSGTDSEGRRSTLIQHYSQINVQMIAVPKLNEEARRIGF